MANVNESVLQIESAIRDAGDNSKLVEARLVIRASLQSLAQIPADTSKSLAETFEAISTSPSCRNTRELGLVAIRLLSCDELLPTGNSDKADRHILRIIDEGCPELIEKVAPSNSKKLQTHEKRRLANTIHTNACEHLARLQLPFSSLQDLVGLRQSIMRELNHGPTKDYLNGFGFASLLPTVSSVFSLVASVTQSEEVELQENMQSLLESIGDDLSHLTDSPTFVARDYVVPFLLDVQKVARELQDTLADRFDCSIAMPSSPYELEKKYPLHIAGTHIRIFIPLTNAGPGTAQNVEFSCIASNCDVLNDETHLGNVPPGRFVLTILFDVLSPCSSAELEVEIRWQVIGEALPQSREFSILVEGQRTDLDWDDLELRQPYSLEVAYGTDFYGRKDAVRRVLRRLAPNAMQSCYITGQKRVGKSSLAHVVKREILTGSHSDNYNVLYLECGEFRHSTGQETLKDLGSRLEEFLVEVLPRPADWKAGDYSSSLAPISRILEQVTRTKPEFRFVIIIDEFDEINEDLYRHGELANTFFLNLRTLSSKPNIAFVLVGAERMPYLIATQGEKLNRFDHESLNSFDRETEWADYLDLVRKPVENIIEEHESALFALYEFTNGHPYFTKMLCATVYECAVEAKDAEVSRNEIERAAQRVIRTLDTNAFAHYWRDGIRGDASDREIVSLKRCRLLVAWARTARHNQHLDCETIQSNVHSANLDAAEVRPLLDDFCRRGVFNEKEGAYFPTVKLFTDWLVDSGFSKLIADQLGDELAEAKMIAEDNAYVRPQEIVDVSTRWQTYQGLEVTPEQVRAWLGQAESNVEQRLLFKLIEHLRFFGDAEIREKFVTAHTSIRRKLPVPVRTSRAQRRKDIVVTFVDGLGKSGAHYAQLYANANEIISDNVVPPAELAVKFSNSEDAPLGLVIVDDVAGTGYNLVEKLSALSVLLQETKFDTKIPVSVVVLCGTKEGERRVRKYLVESMPNADLEICENLEEKHFAFGEPLGFWESEEEKSIAKTLVTDLGSRVQAKTPLGFGDQGLLLTFSRNCPNNSLPILHGSGKPTRQWTPLFPRTKN